MVLDESTSALDTEAEEGLYRVLHDVSRARNVSYVSMGYMSSLVKYHDRRLTLSKRVEGWSLEACSVENGGGSND